MRLTVAALVLVVAGSTAHASMFRQPPPIAQGPNGVVQVTVSQSPPDAIDWTYRSLIGGPTRIIEYPVTWVQRTTPLLDGQLYARMEFILDTPQVDTVLSIRPTVAESALDEFALVIGPATTGPSPLGETIAGYTVQIISTLGTREFFVGAGSRVPEPAAWALALPGLPLLRRRR